MNSMDKNKIINNLKKNNTIKLVNQNYINILLILSGLLFGYMFFSCFEYKYYNCSYTLSFYCIIIGIYVSYKLLLKKYKNVLDNLILLLFINIVSFHTVHFYYKYNNLYEIDSIINTILTTKNKLHITINE